MADAPDIEDRSEEAPLRHPTSTETAHLLDAAFATSTKWRTVPDRFHSLARINGLDAEAEAALPARRALQYFLEPIKKSGRDSVALRWTAALSETRTPNPRSESPEIASAWKALLQWTTHPASQSRLLDLLTVRGGPEAPTLAASAMNTYLDHVTHLESTIQTAADSIERLWSSRNLALALGRALSLIHIATSAPEGPTACARAIEVALNHVSKGIESTTQKVGDTVLILAILTANNKHLSSDSIATLKSLVNAGMRRYSDVEHVVDELAQLAIRIDPSDREAVTRFRIQVRLDTATVRPPLAAMSLLEEAARLAQNHHFSDLANEAVRRMQRTAKEEDLGFATFSHSISIPSEIINAEIHKISDGRDWREALTRLPTSQASAPESRHDYACDHRHQRHIEYHHAIRAPTSAVQQSVG